MTDYGTGLQGMADRLDAVGGTLQLRSESGGARSSSDAYRPAADRQRDIDWLWHLLGSIPAAEGQLGDLDDSRLDIASLITAINGYIPAVVTIGERRRLEGTRPPYLSGEDSRTGIASIRSHSLVPAKA